MGLKTRRKTSVTRKEKYKLKDFQIFKIILKIKTILRKIKTFYYCISDCPQKCNLNFSKFISFT
jgi:hypothetical protein